MLAALVIVFREVIEAGLIVGIVLAAAKGVPGRGRMVALGILGGIAGACLVAAFAGQLGALFAGSGQEIFDAAILIGAVVMLTWHNVWMASHGRQMAREVREIGNEVSQGRRPLSALGIVVGVAVLREGSEVVLFLYGIGAAGGVSAIGMATGGVLGVVAGAAVAALIYLGLLAIPAHRLFTATSWLITLLAAGMACQAVNFIQQAGYATVMQEPLWDTSWLLSENSIPGRLVHTLIGYTAQPDGLQVIAYLATILVIWGLSRAVAAPSRRPAVAAR